MAASATTARQAGDAAAARFERPPVRASLEPGEVQLWLVDLDEVPDAMLGTLSRQELPRADSARPAANAQRARARAVLRELLARYGAGAPGRIELAHGACGKPALAGAGGPSFNLSHSGSLALYAFALDRAVGVDVECLRPISRASELGGRLLGDVERRHLESLDVARRERRFLRAWVRHEAIAKWSGSGLGTAGRSARGQDPWVGEIDLGAGACAALCVTPPASTLRLWRWAPRRCGC